MRKLIDKLKKSVRVHPNPDPEDGNSGSAKANSLSTEELGAYFTISSTGSTFASESAATAAEEGNQRHRRQGQQQQQKQMSQDAEDGPEVVFVEPAKWREDAHAHLYNASRPPMNQDEFDKRFHYRPPPDIDAEMKRRSKKFIRHYYRPCLSGEEFMQFFFRLVPILRWLPLYSWRQNLLNDVIGGIIVGVMHVPQGIAYAKLAGVDPVVGLYTSFLPPLFYMLFGTSRHNSIGSFAVVALMSGAAVKQFSAAYLQEMEAADGNWTTMASATQLPGAAAANAADQLLLSPVVVSSTLACCVGLLQIAMGVFRLELISTYFSDQLIAGFTTGASMHVFVAQLPDIFGLKTPERRGAGNLFQKLYDIFSNLDHTNLYTLALSIFALFFLCIGKDFVNPSLKRSYHLKVPIPFELLLMIVATALSRFFHFHSQYQVRIVDHIPTGLPSPMLPDFWLMLRLLPDALGIAAVVIAVHISLAKMFAKKMAYRVDPAQELFALGFSSSLSSFFPAYPVSCSLGRTLVNVEAGTKTQLSTVFSSALLAAIILYFGQWLRTLPRCILSAIICMALKGLLKKFSDLRTLWPLSKIDFSIWLVSFVATVCWDVTQGLAVAICFALMTTVFRTQWPRWHFLANLSGTNDFRDAERYEMVCAYPGICIFRFDSPLLFTNVDNFRETIHKAFRRWNRYQDKHLGGGGKKSLLMNGEDQQQQRSNGRSSQQLVAADLLSPLDALKHRVPNGRENSHSSDDESDVLAITRNATTQIACTANGCVAVLSKIVVGEQDSSSSMMESQKKPFSLKMAAPIYYRHFIVDCSGFTFVDCMGVNALKEIFTEMRAQRVLVYFAAAKVPVRDLFEKCGFYQYVQKHNFYPTIRDAVAIARKRRNASTQHLLDEPAERHYDAMDTMQNTQPMN